MLKDASNPADGETRKRNSGKTISQRVAAGPVYGQKEHFRCRGNYAAAYPVRFIQLLVARRAQKSAGFLSFSQTLKNHANDNSDKHDDKRQQCEAHAWMARDNYQG